MIVLACTFLCTAPQEHNGICPISFLQLMRASSRWNIPIRMCYTQGKSKSIKLDNSKGSSTVATTVQWLLKGMRGTKETCTSTFLGPLRNMRADPTCVCVSRRKRSLASQVMRNEDIHIPSIFKILSTTGHVHHVWLLISIYLRGLALPWGHNSFKH